MKQKVDSKKVQRKNLSLDNDLQRFGISRVCEGLVGIKDLIQLEVMSDELCGINFFRLH